MLIVCFFVIQLWPDDHYTLYLHSAHYTSARSFSALIQSLWKVWAKSQRETITCTSIINYALKSEVAITLLLQHKFRLLQKMWEKSMTSQWEGISHYPRSTPCIVSKKNREHRLLVHETCIVHTVVGKKARFGTKQHPAVKNHLREAVALSIVELRL